MNILFIVPEEYEGDRWGGVTTYSLYTARQLYAQGNSVSILTPGEKPAHDIQQGIHIYKVWGDNKHGLLDKVIHKIFPKVLARIYWQRAVLRFVRAHNTFTIIEAPEWGSSTLFLSIYKISTIVVRLHRSTYQYLKDNDLPVKIEDRIINVLEWLSIVFANAVTAPTVFMSTQHSLLTAVFKIIKKTIEIIPNGVSMHDTYRAKSLRVKYKRILFVGRLEIGKGCDCLIQAIEKVLVEVPTVQLLMIGEDTHMYINNVYCSFKHQLLSFISNKKMKQHIRFIPRVRNSQLYRYYKTCSVFVIPSVGYENCPMSLLEAISYNLPVVGSNAGGIPEIINHTRAGLLFKQRDSNDLADKILLLLHNTHTREAIMQNIQKEKYTYDITRTALLTKDLYQKLSGKSGKRQRI